MRVIGMHIEVEDTFADDDFTGYRGVVKLNNRTVFFGPISYDHDHENVLDETEEAFVNTLRKVLQP